MVDFINSWAKGIIVAVIIATIIELILPEGNNKKYVKTILGIYILFVIIYPLISKISSKNITAQDLIQNATDEMNKYESNSNISIETNAYVEKTYKQNLQEDIKNNCDEKGYNVENINIEIETENQDKYGYINSISMTVKKQEDTDTTSSDTISKVQKVEIGSYKNTSNDCNNSLSNEEIDDLKEYICTTYSIETEKIKINE